MKDNNLKKNIIWNMIGSLTVAITSLFYTIVLARYSSLELTGLYTIAFALACNTVTIASFGGRTYQVTDTKNEISTFSYIFARYLTVFFTIGILLFYLVAMDYSFYKFIVILLICIFKYLEELCDVYYGIMQKQEKLYLVGQFQFIKSIINIIIFFITISCFNDLLFTFVVLIFINILYFVFLERKAAGKCEKWQYKINKKELKTYFKANIYICILTFSTTYIINFPKYLIERFLTYDLQAIFGIIVMPATVMLLVGNFILNPVLVSIANYYNEGKVYAIQKLMFKILGIMFGIGSLGFVICYFLGIPFFNFIYNLELGDYKLSLLIIIIGSIFYALTAGISSVLVAMRKLKIQVIGNIIVLLMAYLIGEWLVVRYGILGASLIYTFLIIIRFLIYFVVFEVLVWKLLKKEKF